MIIHGAHYKGGARDHEARISVAPPAARAPQRRAFFWLSLPAPTHPGAGVVGFEAKADQTRRMCVLKREGVEFERGVRRVLARREAIERGADPRVTASIQNYFRDVNDHVKLVHDEISSQRELLTSILEANLAVLGVRQNEISVNQNEAMKKLTLVATIFLPLSFVVGFFGMNFGWMVGHVTSFAAFAAYGLGSLLVSCAVIVLLFRRSGYL